MAEDILDEIEEEVIEEDIFFRSPRFKNDIKKREFKIDSPPPSEKVEDVPVMYIVRTSYYYGNGKSYYKYSFSSKCYKQ